MLFIFNEFKWYLSVIFFVSLDVHEAWPIPLQSNHRRGKAVHQRLQGYRGGADIRHLQPMSVG